MLHRAGSDFRTVLKLVLNLSNEECNKSSTEIFIDSQHFTAVENREILEKSSENCGGNKLNIFFPPIVLEKTRAVGSLTLAVN